MPEGIPTLTRAGRLATITLRRPSQRNSLTDEDLETLLTHFAAVDADESVSVLLLQAQTHDAAQPVFSAGYHVGGFDADVMAPLFFEKIPEALARLRPVTVCAVSGSVYGGATDLVLACDLRVGLQGAQWRMPACAIGLHYYPSGLRRYVSQLGLGLTQQAFLLGQPLAFEDLQARELFVRLAPAQAWQASVDAVIEPLLRMAPLALTATKRSLQEIGAGAYSEARLRERSRQSVHSADFAEGRLAMAERRAPRFEGR